MEININPHIEVTILSSDGDVVEVLKFTKPEWETVSQAAAYLGQQPVQYLETLIIQLLENLKSTVIYDDHDNIVGIDSGFDN